jgi:hypothetical protein
VTRKSKKSDLEDLQKAHYPKARALFEQYKIISLDFTKQTHATDLFLANMGSGRLTDGDARNGHSTGR